MQLLELVSNSKVMDVSDCAAFPNLSLANACLTISHGNAVAERGFSVNTALLTKDKLSLEETTILAVTVVKEAIRLYGTPAAVPVTQSDQCSATGSLIVFELLGG